MGLLQPRWVYDDGLPVDYSMSIPQQPWDLGSRGFGGSDNSAAGVPSAFEIRRDYLMHLTLRFPVTEWDDVERLVRHLQRAGSATFYPDQDDTSVAHTVYGESPSIDEEIRPRRDAAPSVFGLDVSIRRTTEAIFTDPYFGDLLFHWRAATTVTGSVFTRSSTAYYVGRDGVLAIAAANEERPQWGGDGFATPEMPVEDARTNGWTYSEQLNNGAWSKTRSSISADATTAPDGASTADKLVEDATASNTHFLRRNTPALTDDTDQALTFFAKAAERTELRVVLKGKDDVSRTVWYDLSAGTVGTTSNATGRMTALADGWYRCELVGDSNNGGTTPRVDIQLGSGGETQTYSGDGASGAYLWGLQFETDQPFASSYIQTVASTVTRAVETQAIPYVKPPRGLTVLISFTEAGGVEIANARLFAISATTARFYVASQSGTRYRLAHQTSAGTVTSDASPGSSIGERVDILCHLYPDGAVQIHHSYDRAAVVSGSKSAAHALAADWDDLTVYIGARATGGSVGFNSFHGIKISRDIKTMDQMRALVS